MIRRTIKNKCSLDGVGLHSGVPVKVTFHPGSKGIHFVLGAERVEARPENVSDVSRCTRLGSISTIEHVMATLACLEITDVDVEVTANELPGLDGSSLPYVQLLSSIGTEDLNEVAVPQLFKRVVETEGDAKINIGSGTGQWRYRFVTEDRFPGEQIFESLSVCRDFPTEIAPARTFVLSEEIPMVIQHGLGKGLDPTSAVMVGPDGYDNSVRFPDELARHKLLDLIGDLYLAGLPVASLNVTAERSGHRLNVATAAKLSALAAASGVR